MRAYLGPNEGDIVVRKTGLRVGAELLRLNSVFRHIVELRQKLKPWPDFNR